MRDNTEEKKTKSSFYDLLQRFSALSQNAKNYSTDEYHFLFESLKQDYYSML
ncbi:hypothetical protein [Lacinutrix sp. Hel_I_90]|uniref:hypothetical protein n=1 Tax=Lacinutrix sp. Hel_I_90 TaxID=1249999 RepID=UPI000A7AFF70|nr:hypothetical protein [Lacinutrix sp. Hel_I_90]